MKLINKFQYKRLHKRALKRYQSLQKDVSSLDIRDLRSLRGRTKEMKSAVDKIVHLCDARLATPFIDASTLRVPSQSDWSHRPEIWAGPVFPRGVAAVEDGATLGESLKIFHDCIAKQTTIKQIPNTRQTDLSPFSLTVEAYEFKGSFMSLSISLPETALEDMRSNHIYGIQTELEMEHPIEIYTRLNIRFGPNVEQITKNLEINETTGEAEFDLSDIKVTERRLERIWLDLFLNNPRMNAVTFRDMTMYRRPRAEF